jgi:hypothetical protein
VTVVSASFGPFGTVLASTPCPCPPITTRLTASKGFPWTTGTLTILVPSAQPPETLVLWGSDMRVAGVGNISLVSGGVTLRALSSFSATRGWLSLTLPEPDAALGAACALAVLAVCYGSFGRRSAPAP